MKGIDCAMEVSAEAATEIKAAGYDFVCRYLVPSTMAWKDLTLQEAQGISAGGLKLLCVYETTADRVKGGAVAGAKDGKTARALAEAIGMPTSGYLYFAVDYEPTTADLDTIEEYLRAAAEAAEDYPVGVYGNYNVVEAMKARGAAVGFWQCYAWSYGKKSEYRTLYQYQNAQSIAGISIDLNEAYSEAGFWSYKESEDEEDVERYAKLEKVPADWDEHGNPRAMVELLMSAGIIAGDGSDKKGNEDVIDLSKDMVRILTYEFRGGLYDDEIIAAGFDPDSIR